MCFLRAYNRSTRVEWNLWLAFGWKLFRLYFYHQYISCEFSEDFTADSDRSDVRVIRLGRHSLQTLRRLCRLRLRSSADSKETWTYESEYEFATSRVSFLTFLSLFLSLFGIFLVRDDDKAILCPKHSFCGEFSNFFKKIVKKNWGSLPPPKIGLKRSRDRPKIRKIPKIFKKIENFQNFKNLIFFKKYNNMDPKPLRNARYRSRTRPNPPEVVTCPTNKSEKFSKFSDFFEKKWKIFKISKKYFFRKIQKYES